MNKDYIPTYFYLCPQCHNYPFMFFDYTKEMKITIRCICGFTKEYMVNEFVSLLNERNTIIDCEIHKRPFSKYCLTCNIHLCYKCEKHKGHKKYKLGKIENIKEIKYKLEEAYDFIQTSISSIKDKTILLFSCHKKYKNKEKFINKLIDECNEKIYLNCNLLTIIASLVDSYSKYHPNYFLEKNIQRNCNVSIDMPKQKKLYKYKKRNRPLLKDCSAGIEFINSFYVAHPQILAIDTDIHVCVMSNEYIIILQHSDGIDIYNMYLNTIEFSIPEFLEGMTKLTDEKYIGYNNDTVYFYTINVKKKKYTSSKAFKCKGWIKNVVGLNNNRVAVLIGSVGEISIYSTNSPFNLIKTFANVMNRYYSMRPDEMYPWGDFSDMSYYKDRDILLTSGSICVHLWNMKNYQIITYILTENGHGKVFPLGEQKIIMNPNVIYDLQTGTTFRIKGPCNEICLILNCATYLKNGFSVVKYGGHENILYLYDTQFNLVKIISNFGNFHGPIKNVFSVNEDSFIVCGNSIIKLVYY